MSGYPKEYRDSCVYVHLHLVLKISKVIPYLFLFPLLDTRKQKSRVIQGSSEM